MALCVAAVAASPASTAPRASLESCRARHRLAPPIRPRLPRRPLAPCAFGGGDTDGGSMDGEEISLSRELERRSGAYRSLAAHLDLLYQASSTSKDTVQQCSCCRGSGEQECGWCHGTGAMTVGEMLYCSESGCTPCPVCRGTGQCKCPDCRGTGKRASWLVRPPS